MNEEKTGDTIPLYEEVKRNIYRLYQELKNVSSMIISSRNLYDYNVNINIFNEYYIKFYMEIKTSNKFDKLEEVQKIYLFKAYKKILTGKNLSRLQISRINLLATILVEKLGISKIGSKQRDNYAL